MEKGAKWQEIDWATKLISNDRANRDKGTPLVGLEGMGPN